jgi:hypothetical protein
MRFMGTVVGLICGGGIALGLFFGGMAMWPPEGVEGSCQITSIAGVTYECVGSRGKKFKLNVANVTFEDGSTRQCAGFWLTDKCPTFGLGSDKPTEILEGQARPCLWFKEEIGKSKLSSFSAPAGACVEPGKMGTDKFWCIAVWILAASLFCCCFCCGLNRDAKGDSKDAGSHDANGDNKHASAHLGGEAATTTDSSCV